MISFVIKAACDLLCGWPPLMRLCWFNYHTSVLGSKYEERRRRVPFIFTECIKAYGFTRDLRFICVAYIVGENRTN